MSRPGRSRSPSARPRGSSWRAVRMPDHHAVVRTLRERHALRWHGLLIGSFTMLLMWATAHGLMRVGVESLAVRYAVVLTTGYLAYLLVLRAWAARLVAPRRASADGDDCLGLDDVLDIATELPWPRGRSGAVPAQDAGVGSAFDGLASADLGDVAGGAVDAVASADDGAVVIVPVVAIFLIVGAMVVGAGSLALLFFGWDVLLAVAVELAFSVAAARAAMGVERAGWLGAAVRLTWKPLLGALACAVVLGASIDHFLPGVQSLPEAVRMLQGR